LSELEVPPLVPELAAGEPVAELTDFEKHRAAQREAEHLTPLGLLPNVLHLGDEKVPPLVRTPSGALYAIRRHRRLVRHGDKQVVVESYQHVRVDRAPRSKKERRRLRALAKAQRAAQAEDLCRDGAREARQAHNLEISGCNSQPCNQSSQESLS